METGKKYAVWLKDDHARAFVGVDPMTSRPSTPSRWLVLGEFLGEETTGFWLRVDHVEEWTAMSRIGQVFFSHPACLIPWHAIITVQAGLETFEGVTQKLLS